MSDVIISSDVREAIDRSVLCWLATATRAGEPSVSPKQVFTHRDGTILISNIASPNSAKNIKANPSVCVVVLDIFRQKGYQLYGRADVVTSADASFEALAAPLRDIAGDAFPFRSIFRVEVIRVALILAPRYRLNPETTEADQVEDAMRSYGVRPDSEPS
ncbi:MAG: pyridoxamine 5'-phosphate oxidase family protein [Phycisphaerales bacterium]